MISEKKNSKVSDIGVIGDKVQTFCISLDIDFACPRFLTYLFRWECLVLMIYMMWLQKK